MRSSRHLLVLLLFSLSGPAWSQETDTRATISLYSGMINYQGDLNPNSFTFHHSNFSAGLIIRKPLNRWFTARGSFLTGKLTAADRWNRDYLKPRNLSFTTSITEATIALEITIFDEVNSRLTPYMYGGISFFHFNPWAYDQAGTKTFLKPLSTEGQGLSEYPEQKPYALYQWALPFGGGIKYAVSEGFRIGLDFSQRKTFTDYVDDVSSHYVDASILEQARGRKAIEMAYRSDELPGGRPDFPAQGEQRGTPSEMDWYYYFGMTFEIKLSEVGNVFDVFGSNKGKGQGCPIF